MRIKSNQDLQAEIVESAWQLRETDTHQSMSMAEELRHTQPENTHLVACSLIVESHGLWRVGRFEQMMENLIKVFETLSSSKDYLWIARMHGRIGAGLAALGDVTNAYKHSHLQLEAALQVTPGALQNEELFAVYHNMGRHFFVKGDYKRANRCYRRCYSYIETSNHSFVLLLQNHADTHARLGQFQVASMEIDRALELGPQVSAFRAMVYAMGVKAWIHKAQNQLDQAREMHIAAKKLALKHSLPTVQQRMRLASLYIDRKQFTRAVAALRPVEHLIKLEGDKHDHAQYQLLNSDLSYALGQYKSALAHFRQYHQIKELIFSAEKDSKAHSEILLNRLGQLRREAVHLKQRNLALQDSVSHLKSLHKEARELSERDYLTTLYNRRVSKSMAGKIIKLAEHTHSTVALAVIDIDHFKQINDRFGHATGDQVLQKFAAILLRSFRAADCVARYGGEEFVIVMANTELEIAENAIMRLRESVHRYRWSEINSQLHVTFSAGIATGGGSSSFESLFRAADRVLYLAKSTGRNRTCTQHQLSET